MVIDCQNISLGYEGNMVVRNISFSVETGDYLWVVGENGSGKSTLIRGILKLLNPLEGNIIFCDELKQGKIGYLSQQSAPKKDFPAGVNEIVLSGNLSGMGLRPFYTAKEKKSAENAMKWLGIESLAKKCYRELSSGQQRRVLLARAFVSARVENTGESLAKSLLVLDEPTAGLDPLVTVEVYELLKTLNRQTGITIIMVSHDTRGAEQYANRILHLENGRGFFSDTADYLGSDRGRKFFGIEKEKKND
jgi:zinc transport system ATP-binding protein